MKRQAGLTISKRKLVPEVFDGSPEPSDYEAIGRFISAMSLVEITMHQVIRFWAGIDDGLARALIGEPRIGELIAHLRTTQEYQKHVAFDDRGREVLDAIYAEIGLLNNVRAVVAHKPCLSDGRRLMFHNSLTAAKPTKLFREYYTARQLYKCSQHALHVSWALTSAIMIPTEGYERWISQSRERLAFVPKSELPSPRSSTSPTTAQERKPRPRSSPPKGGK